MVDAAKRAGITECYWPGPHADEKVLAFPNPLGHNDCGDLVDLGLQHQYRLPSGLLPEWRSTSFTERDELLGSSDAIEGPTLAYG